MKRFCICCAVLLVCFLVALRTTAVPAQADKTPEDTLLSDLQQAYDDPSAESLSRIDQDLEAVTDPVFAFVAERWKEIYLDPSFTLNYDGTDDPFLLPVPDPSSHAFVVLGFCLRDGEMQPELKSRCRAAATAARAWPEALIICTGGPTGVNNPDRKTEAGLMRRYLVRTCKIPSGRILAEKEARTTVENAVNTFRILRERNIRSITLVTSGYHMRWALMVFHTVAWQNQRDGYPVEIIGSWCCDVPPAPGYDRMNAELALSQLRQLLRVPAVR